jgi:hypothetical protein
MTTPYGLEPQDAYGRHWLKVIQLLESGDTETRDRAHFAVAEEARRNLHRIKAKYVPTRPGTVPCDDDILHMALDQKKPQPNTPRARTLAMFSAWRTAVWKAEIENLASMLVAGRAVLTYRRLGCPKFAAELEQFLEDEHDVREPVPARPGELEAWAARGSRRMGVLSWELRNMERRPRVFTGPHPEDDDSTWADGQLPTIPDAADFQDPF